MARPTGRPIREEILTLTEQLIQRAGVGAFSYNQVADKIGIKAPTIHHYFKRKEDLVAEVAAGYRERFASEVRAITGETASDRLREFTDLFARTASDDLMCLCGALAAEWATAGDEPRKVVEGFLDDQIHWLTDQICDGIKHGEFRRELDPTASAKTILATLEGAVLLNRADSSSDPVSLVSGVLLSLLAPVPAPN